MEYISTLNINGSHIFMLAIIMLVWYRKSVWKEKYLNVWNNK